MSLKCLKCCDEFLVAVGIGTVASFQIGQTIDVVLLGERVGGFLGDDHIVAQTESVGSGVAAAHVGMQTRHHNRFHAEFSKQNVEVGLEETAVAALGHYVVLFAEIQFGNHLGALRAGNGVVAPDDEFAVDAFAVRIVAEDDGNASLTSRVEQLCGSGNDGAASVASQSARYEVVEHINNENGGFVQFFHFVFCL